MYRDKDYVFNKYKSDFLRPYLNDPINFEDSNYIIVLIIS